MDRDALEQALTTLGQLLARRDEPCRLAVVGGGAMLLLGLVDRPTQDLDLVGQIDGSSVTSAEPLPPGLADAVADVARARGLALDWLNPGPASLLDLGLPDGFAKRAHVRIYDGLELWVADRFDQIHLKLYAAVDLGPESKHVSDLRRLRPTRDELDAAAAWAVTHDPSEAFAAELRAAVAALGGSDDD